MKKIIVLIAALGALSTVLLGLTASASAAPPPSVHGAQSFVILSDNPTATVNPVVATGTIIKGKGSDRQLSNTLDRFAFLRGSLFVRHHRTSGTNNYDRNTCLGTVTETGTYRIIAGTRLYRGASGRGTYSLNIQFISCNLRAAPDVFQESVNASGNIRYPVAA
jgi:hypothetical protein